VECTCSKDFSTCYSAGTGWDVTKKSYSYSELLVFGSLAKSSLRLLHPWGIDLKLYLRKSARHRRTPAPLLETVKFGESKENEIDIGNNAGRGEQDVEDRIVGLN